MTKSILQGDLIMPYNICALIPTCNHHSTLPGIVARLKAIKLDVVIIDDGSTKETKQALKNITDVHVLTLHMNEGKGAAIYAGLVWAKKIGYTHIFQVDADGQHSLDKLESFLALSLQNPQALISGQPIYDRSMPLARRIDRWFTHVWVWIETLSFRITDSMCGYRIYPVEPTLKTIECFSIGKRMDFDTEIMVRLFWQGIPVVMSPVKVTYPQGNLSNFDVARDNWRITKMHTKLVFSMLGNLRMILKKRPNYTLLNLPSDSIHWASLRERAPLLGLFFLAYCYRLLGKRACLIIGTPIILYYYLTNKTPRQASKDFLARAFVFRGSTEKPNTFKHFMSFLEMALDKFAAWTGQMKWDHVDDTSQDQLLKLMDSSRGGMLLVSHLGNMELCRAVAPFQHQKRLHILLQHKN